MTREERELRNQISVLKAEARNLVAEDKLKEAKAKAKEAENLTEKADLLAKLEDESNLGGIPLSKGEKKDLEDRKALYRKAFFKAFRRQKLSADERQMLDEGEGGGTVTGLHETPDENGGLLLPQDVQTAINQYKRTLSELEPFITVTPVTTLSGSRVYEKVATMTPLEELEADDQDIPETDNPTFEKVSYKIKDYGGWLPVPKDLLDDSDQNILAYLTQWFGKKSVVTRNTHILSILTALTPTAFADYKAIKKALNVTLDPMLAASAIIVTNQDGFQYLDTLEDKNGKPLLQADVTQPTQKLFAGKPVHVIGNNVLATTGTDKKLAPIFVGSLADAVVMFERQGYQIATTDVGGTAWRKNRTEIRMIEREDFRQIDPAAVVYGKIDVTSVL
ncbi:phage major capsid protein [Caproiciproducens galactitolivorans]|uniref:Phage capsid family protein n=1 Tax=Caproiciproducens galactitolivorans TaxID=642589 RepID=A0A4Z0XVP0_9FIRM|nr:phage major capsid protein [Caproiciproducens galactitolivorans]QEY34621.1 phage major capsid protein [Caproiciproducens galactitolivorans]TGJ75414.1 phage capsid family protein [Caproiciproducens galactitolivorans]